MTNDELLSKTISYLRFPLIVGVVFIHCYFARRGFLLNGVKYGADYPDWYHNFINFFCHVLPRMCVPLFFFISGFLFFNKIFTLSLYIEKLRSRVRTLLVPFLMWNTIAIVAGIIATLSIKSSTEVQISLIRIFYTYFANYKNYGIFVTPIEDNLVEASNNPWPIDGPTWYIRDLMVMVILTPIIYWIIKRFDKWAIIVLGFIWFSYGHFFQPNGGWFSLLTSAFFFFSWGAYYGINKMNFVAIFRKHTYAPLIYLPIAIIDTYTKGTDYNFFIHNTGIIAGMISVVVIVSYLLNKGIVKVNLLLANCSFIVYAFHIMIIERIARRIYAVLCLPDEPYVMVIMFFIVPIITITLCVFLYMILKRYTPTLCNLLTGGR